jgi:hypothetical protein
MACYSVRLVVDASLSGLQNSGSVQNSGSEHNLAKIRGQSTFFINGLQESSSRKMPRSAHNPDRSQAFFCAEVIAPKIALTPNFKKNVL